MHDFQALSETGGTIFEALKKHPSYKAFNSQ